MIAARPSIFHYAAAYDLSLHPFVQPYLHNNLGSTTHSTCSLPTGCFFLSRSALNGQVRDWTVKIVAPLLRLCLTT
jgi:hypothetical protein